MDHQLHRLMGSRHEISRQPSRDPLDSLLDWIDPWNDPHMDSDAEEAREETEVDVWESNGPMQRVKLEDGTFEMRTEQTARTPRGEERHALNGKILRTKLIPRNE